MKIENIKLFLLVAQSESISQAAEIAFVSPQNMSFIMKQLENELGMQLFLRSNQGVVLSTEGEQFFPYAKRIADTYDEFLKVRQVPSVNNVIHLYTTPTLASHIKLLQGYQLSAGNYISIDKYSVDVLMSMLQNKKEGCYFLPVRGELAKKLSTMKEKMIIAQSSTHVVACHKDNPLLLADAVERQQKGIFMFDNSDFSETAHNTINVDDFATSKQLMREKGFLYITSSNLFQMKFLEDEWVVLEETENEPVAYTLFFNLNGLSAVLQRQLRSEIGLLLKNTFI